VRPAPHLIHPQLRGPGQR